MIKTKKYVSILLVIVIVMSAVGLSAFARDSEWSHKDIDADHVICLGGGYFTVATYAENLPRDAEFVPAGLVDVADLLLNAQMLVAKCANINFEDVAPFGDVCCHLMRVVWMRVMWLNIGPGLYIPVYGFMCTTCGAVHTRP